MVIIDVAILQSEIHYNLAHSNRNHNRHCVVFHETLSNELINTDWRKIVKTYSTRNKSSNSADMDDLDEQVTYESLLQNLGVSLTSGHVGNLPCFQGPSDWGAGDLMVEIRLETGPARPDSWA